MIRKYLFIIIAAFALQMNAQDNDKIMQAVENNMKMYPKSHLKDIYKTCFQDVYGPGHIINDTTSAGKYLRQELTIMGKTRCKNFYEPTGVDGRFYRVSLNVIKEGIVDYNKFFDAFIRSTKDVKPLPIAEWAKRWAKIEDAVRTVAPDMPNFKADSAAISRLLSKGKYAAEHSKAFRDAYAPHYRIMKKEIFEKDILPEIKLFERADSNGYIVYEGDIAPDFTAKTTDGRTIRLSDLRGKVVMLQFTASWCSVCRREMPYIESDIWQKNIDRNNFVLLGIDRDEPLEKVISFGRSVGVTYPLCLDPGAEIYSKYALKESGITRNVLIDRDGKIVKRTRLYNPKEFNSLVEKINELLK